MMKLMDHQARDVERYVDSDIIPLFYDCGTGKTLTSSVIAARKFAKGQLDCVLVVAPNGIDVQWAFQELPLYIKEGMLPQNTIVLGGKAFKEDKTPIPYAPGHLHFVCVNIDKFASATGYQRYVDWCCAHKSMIIVDEATSIKNTGAKRTQRLLYSFNDVVRKGKTILKSAPKTVARCILTGTPVTEAPFDVWSMFEFLRPSYFGLNEYAFNNHYGMFHAIDARGHTIRVLINRDIWYGIRSCANYEQANLIFGVTLDTYDFIMKQSKYEGPYKHLEGLRQQIHKDASFVRITDIQDMPERIYVKRQVDMDAPQSRAYRDMVQTMITQFADIETSATTKLTQMLRLQQISSGFIVPDATLENLEDPNPQQIVWICNEPLKLQRLLADIEEMYNEQIIVLCQFSAEAEKLYEALKDKYSTCLITGFKVVGDIEGFQTGKYQILVGNIRKMAKGFNLQNCHNLMYYSNSFSLENRIQSEARIWRTGQTQKVRYFDYIHSNTIDEKVFQALANKKDVSDYLSTPFKELVYNV